jgi:hypothetical protein
MEHTLDRRSVQSAPIDSAQLTVWRRSTCECLGDLAMVDLIPSDAV